jgi:hypothetical protein
LHSLFLVGGFCSLPAVNASDFCHKKRPGHVMTQYQKNDVMLTKLKFETVRDIAKAITATAASAGMKMNDPELIASIEAMVVSAGWLPEEFISTLNSDNVTKQSATVDGDIKKITNKMS